MKPSIYPSYYKEFSCIGPDCEDSCCDERWNIAIDYFQYLSDSHLKQYVVKHKSPTKNNYGDLKRTSSGACALLTECGTCSVHSDYGEDYLSKTCTVYPRANQVVDGVTERSLSPSCPEAARLILLSQDGIDFTYEESSKEERWDHTNQMYEVPQLWPLRVAIIQLLQERRAPLDARLISVGLLLSKLVDKTSAQQEEVIDELSQTYLHYLQTPDFLNTLNTIETKEAISLKIAIAMLNQRIGKGLLAGNYSELVEEIKEGLFLNGELSNVETVLHYKMMKEQCFVPFFDDHEYMFENYLVNYVFLNMVPIDEKDYMASFTKLVAQYALLKLHLIGVAAKHKGLTPELVVRTVYLFSRRIEHNERYIKDMMKEMKSHGYTTMGHLTILLLS